MVTRVVALIRGLCHLYNYWVYVFHVNDRRVLALTRICSTYMRVIATERFVSLKEGHDAVVTVTALVSSLVKYGPQPIPNYIDPSSKGNIPLP